MPSIEEVDEALHHTSLVPPDCRGAGWEAWVDALLDQRAELENNGGGGATPEPSKRRGNALAKEKQ